MTNQHSKCEYCYKTHLPEAHDGIIVLPSDAFGKGYVPEFNQVSEDVVDSILSTLGIVDRKSGNRPGQIEVVKQIIRTEKLNLLSAVRERVVGEPIPHDWDDDIDDMTKWKYYTGYESNANDFVAGYNRSRAEQLKQLTKLEAEL